MIRTKAEVACLLLDRAIWQYFHGDDLAVVHNMAHAAHTVLRDVAKASHADRHFEARLFASLKAQGVVMPDGSALESHRQFADFMNAQANGLKHADRERGDLSIEPEPIQAAMALGCSHAVQLGIVTRAQIVCLVWIARRSNAAPDLLQDTPMARAFEGLNTMGREEALEVGAKFLCADGINTTAPFTCPRHATAPF